MMAMAMTGFLTKKGRTAISTHKNLGSMLVKDATILLERASTKRTPGNSATIMAKKGNAPSNPTMVLLAPYWSAKAIR
jgi:hypothetical protein